MMDRRPVRVPVYLTCRVVRDRTGSELAFRERCLVPRSEEDRVIAVIQAPPGTRVRRRRDRHGTDQLVVPKGDSLWARLFGGRVAIPAKYVISDARSRSNGLKLLTEPEETHEPEPSPEPEPQTAELVG